MYRWSFLAPALLLCLWTGAVNDLAWAQSPAPASDPGQATPAPAVPPSEKAAEPAQSPAPAPADKPAAPAPQAAAPQPGPAAAGTVPPANSPPLVRFIELTFPTQGNQSVIDPQTYVYYIQTQISRPSAGVWIPYNDKT